MGTIKGKPFGPAQTNYGNAQLSETGFDLPIWPGQGHNQLHSNEAIRFVRAANVLVKDRLSTVKALYR